MAVECNYGSMDLYTKDIGVKIRPMVEVDSSMLTVMFMTESGKMTKLMVMAIIITLMEPVMKVNGTRTSSMARVKRSGLTVPTTKVSILMERSMDKACSTGQMDLLTMASSLTTTFKATESTPGLMAESIKDNGSVIKCTELESSLGLMVAGTRGNT